jgi:putative Holliday junction resolvase
VAEWSIAPVLKTGVSQGTVGSNPTLSAMKYLGIDYGTKRIGVAVSDETATLAFPLGTIKSGEAAIKEVLDLVRENNVGKVIIGESRNYDGSENPVMKYIEVFKRKLEDAELAVELEPEFMTSSAAARQFAPDGSRKQNPSHEQLDSSAAALILQNYLDRNREGQQS